MANGVVTPPRTRSPQSILQAGVPEFVPTAYPSSPESPFANVSYQYPHSVVTGTYYGGARSPEPVPPTGNAYSPFDSEDDEPHQEVNMRVYCWHKYGWVIGDIRMEGLAALQAECEPPVIACQGGTFEGLDIWYFLEEVARADKVEEEERIREAQAAAAADTTATLMEDLSAEDVWETGSSGSETDSTSGHLISTANSATLAIEPHMEDTSPEEELDMEMSHIIELNSVRALPEGEDDDCIDPEDARYAQPHANVEIEVELIDEDLTDFHKLPITKDAAHAEEMPSVIATADIDDGKRRMGVLRQRRRSMIRPSPQSPKLP
jgi:hypothetical protein